MLRGDHATMTHERALTWKLVCETWCIEAMTKAPNRLIDTLEMCQVCQACQACQV